MSIIYYVIFKNNTKTIYINEELSDSMLKKVLCHELTHAAMFSYDVELTMEQEEMLADLIATYGQEIISITNLIFLKTNNPPTSTHLYS